MHKRIFRALIGPAVATGLAFTFLLGTPQQVIFAGPLLQPSPRPIVPTPTALPPTETPVSPTEVPTAIPTDIPTALPSATPDNTSSGSNSPPPTATPAPGRLTGTVIDLRTGAPVGGVPVRITSNDGRLFFNPTTDQNGNYEMILPTGAYLLELSPVGEQGVSAQGTQSILVGSGDTVVVHLFLNSVAQPSPVVEAQPAPVEPPPAEEPPPAPALPADPVTTTAPSGPPANAPIGVGSGGSERVPSALPATAGPLGVGLPWVWMLGGALLLGGGALVQMIGNRRRAAAEREEELLASLLDNDPER